MVPQASRKSNEKKSRLFAAEKQPEIAPLAPTLPKSVCGTMPFALEVDACSELYHTRAPRAGHRGKYLPSHPYTASTEPEPPLPPHLAHVSTSTVKTAEDLLLFRPNAPVPPGWAETRRKGLVIIHRPLPPKQEPTKKTATQIKIRAYPTAASLTSRNSSGSLCEAASAPSLFAGPLAAGGSSSNLSTAAQGLQQSQTYVALAPIHSIPETPSPVSLATPPPAPAPAAAATATTTTSPTAPAAPRPLPTPPAMAHSGSVTSLGSASGHPAGLVGRRPPSHSISGRPGDLPPIQFDMDEQLSTSSPRMHRAESRASSSSGRSQPSLLPIGVADSNAWTLVDAPERLKAGVRADLAGVTSSSVTLPLSAHGPRPTHPSTAEIFAQPSPTSSPGPSLGIPVPHSQPPATPTGAQAAVEAVRRNSVAQEAAGGESSGGEEDDEASAEFVHVTGEADERAEGYIEEGEQQGSPNPGPKKSPLRRLIPGLPSLRGHGALSQSVPYMLSEGAHSVPLTIASGSSYRSRAPVGIVTLDDVDIDPDLLAHMRHDEEAGAHPPAAPQQPADSEAAPLPQRGDRRKRSPLSPKGEPPSPTTPTGEPAPGLANSASAGRLSVAFNRAAMLPPVAPMLLEGTTAISYKQIVEIASSLSTKYRHMNWKQLFSSAVHGVSLQTFFWRCNTAPSVLIVVDREGKVFGGFCPEPWQKSGGYYGNGDTFVFTFSPTYQSFRWARTNPYWMMGGEDGIAMGGGSHFALWLTSDFERGTSGTCDTFRSPVLASNEDFRVKIVEVWGLVPS
ncbi:putative oxidation resistance protein 1 [Paratrimastix pyriformis]|uniref:Oxidation resistance protein 1 n=1 Tax=Paratrimastix pyriformis TaxID=342808 RepID=A0ABQ8UXA4_9EUKA|nr:putative oxidation resistance protein 1 [Paratrimastix pyriformis]